MRSLRLLLLALTLLTLNLASAAQPAPPQAVRDYATAHRAELVKQFSEFLAIPNVAADPSGLEKNASFLVSALRSRGADARLLTQPGAPAVVFGQILTPGAEHTIVFYAHYDGQPVTPSEWTIPPFAPIVRTVDGEARIFA